MPDGRPDAKVVEIRIERRESRGEKNPGSIIPGNLRAKKGDEIIWFVSERLEPPLPSSPPKEGVPPVKAKRLLDVNIILTFRPATPFDKNVQIQDRGQIARTVQVAPPDGLEEQVYHYGVVVRDRGNNVIFYEAHCPEIIIQSASGG